MDRYEARKAMVEDLKEQGLLVKVVPHSHSVGTHDRCGTTVEPMIKPQWFVKMDEMAKAAIKTLDDGNLQFVPARFDKTYLLQCGEYHTDNPEEDDIISGYQNICRIEILKLRCLIRPSKCGERPQCGREPCIQCILILCEMCTSTVWAFLRRFFRNYKFTALITVISRRRQKTLITSIRQMFL